MCEAFGDACWVDLRELLHGESLDGQTVASVINATGEALAKQSALMNAISSGLANDGRIDRGELAACKLQMRQAQASLVMLERVLERDAEEYDNG
mgnify:FL=1